jgi:hypothetical protein
MVKARFIELAKEERSPESRAALLTLLLVCYSCYLVFERDNRQKTDPLFVSFYLAESDGCKPLLPKTIDGRWMDLSSYALDIIFSNSTRDGHYTCSPTISNLANNPERVNINDLVNNMWCILGFPFKLFASHTEIDIRSKMNIEIPKMQAFNLTTHSREKIRQIYGPLLQQQPVGQLGVVMDRVTEGMAIFRGKISSGLDKPKDLDIGLYTGWIKDTIMPHILTLLSAHADPETYPNPETYPTLKPTLKPTLHSNPKPYSEIQIKDCSDFSIEPTTPQNQTRKNSFFCKHVTACSPSPMIMRRLIKMVAKSQDGELRKNLSWIQTKVSDHIVNNACPKILIEFMNNFEREVPPVFGGSATDVLKAIRRRDLDACSLNGLKKACKEANLTLPAVTAPVTVTKEVIINAFMRKRRALLDRLRRHHPLSSSRSAASNASNSVSQRSRSEVAAKRSRSPRRATASRSSSSLRSRVKA